MADAARGSPAVFLDRDGTVILDRNYLADPGGVELLPGVGEALRRLRNAGYLLVVVTNQSGIGRGMYGEDAYRRVARRLDDVLAAEGVRLDATRYCPHDPEAVPGCACRKPATGMYLDAAASLGIDTAASWYVGDKASDVLPARALGGRGIRVRTGAGAEPGGGCHAAADGAGFPIVDDLRAAADLILGPAGGETSPGGPPGLP